VSTFIEYLKKGEIAEGVIAKWFISRGHQAFQVKSDYNMSKGPRIEIDGEKYISPDMLVQLSSGKTIYVKAKYKNAFSEYRKKGVFTTGIDRVPYEHYIKVSNGTGIPVWVMFLHQGGIAKDAKLGYSPNGLFGNNINELSANENHRYRGNGIDMVYWTRKEDGGALIKLDSLSNIRRISSSLSNKKQ